MSETVTISFEGSLLVPIEDLDACLGDAAQCVQNRLGRTGAIVVSAHADHIDDDERELDDVSWDALADRELADADRYWPAEQEPE